MTTALCGCWAHCATSIEYLFEEGSKGNTRVFVGLADTVLFDSIHDTRTQQCIWTVSQNEPAMLYAFHSGNPLIWSVDSDSTEKFCTLL